MNKDNDYIPDVGLAYGFDGEIIQLTKYKKNWDKIFDKHNIDKKYKIRENFENFCYLNYAGFDAESMFVQKARELEEE